MKGGVHERQGFRRAHRLRHGDHASMKGGAHELRDQFLEGMALQRLVVPR